MSNSTTPNTYLKRNRVNIDSRAESNVHDEFMSDIMSVYILSFIEQWREITAYVSHILNSFRLIATAARCVKVCLALATLWGFAPPP